MLSQQAVDLVIVDLCPPTLRGLDLVRHLRESHADTPVIATAADDQALLDQARELGAHRGMGKPVRLTHLRRVVTDLLG